MTIYDLLPEIALILRQKGYKVIEHSFNGIVSKLTVKWNDGNNARIIRRGDIAEDSTTRTQLNNEQIFIDWKNLIWEVK